EQSWDRESNLGHPRDRRIYSHCTISDESTSILFGFWLDPECSICQLHGLLWESNPGLLRPKRRIIPLDQVAEHRAPTGLKNRELVWGRLDGFLFLVDVSD